MYGLNVTKHHLAFKIEAKEGTVCYTNRYLAHMPHETIKTNVFRDQLLTKTCITWYTAASKLLRATNAILFWRAYTKDGTLNFSNSVGLPNTFSFKDVINLVRLPVSLQNKIVI